MVEGRDWDGSDEHLFELQEKFNRYASFATDEPLGEKYPEFAGKPVRLELHYVSPPDPRTASFVAVGRERPAEEGLGSWSNGSGAFPRDSVRAGSCTDGSALQILLFRLRSTGGQTAVAAKGRRAFASFRRSRRGCCGVEASRHARAGDCRLRGSGRSSLRTPLCCRRYLGEARRAGGSRQRVEWYMARPRLKGDLPHSAVRLDHDDWTYFSCLRTHPGTQVRHEQVRQEQDAAPGHHFSGRPSAFK